MYKQQMTILLKNNKIQQTISLIFTCTNLHMSSNEKFIPKKTGHQNFFLNCQKYGTNKSPLQLKF